MLKKATLLIMVALTAITVVSPVSASADEWTDAGTVLGESETLSESYEGVLTLSAGLAGTFSCEVTVVVEAEGPSNATLTKFNPTTSSCSGTKAFAGCVLTNEGSNLSSGWHVTSMTPLVITSTGGDITIQYQYSNCLGGQSASHADFGSWPGTFEVHGVVITKLNISAVATSGVALSGALVPEGTPTLGIK